METILQSIVNEINFDELPDRWSLFDQVTFSKTKNLFDYQQEALRNAVKALYLYYERLGDYSPGENPNITDSRKKQLYRLYVDSGAEKRILDIEHNKKNKYLINIYENCFEKDEKGGISFHNFINRMSFWMATGSGKSLLIIKLMHILYELAEKNEIPNNDILLMAPKEELIEQISTLINEFNWYSSKYKIELINLKEFPSLKASLRYHLPNTINVFYYRSDNISDDDKEAIIDYKTYDNNGNWYILLDEAHKGNKEDSKRQAYYSILSRNGYLFNFSATFTDISDIYTTVYNFNLQNFIKAGYGKKIYLTNSEYSSFKNNIDDEFTENDKRKIVLKSLITLCLEKKCVEKIKQIDPSLYHSPLMITLVNSINKEDSDLIIFFSELEKFAKGEYDADLFDEVKGELKEEFNKNNKYLTSNEIITLNKATKEIFDSITVKDVLRYVYNSDSHGSIEVITSNNSKELAFRLKSSDKTSSPFALIKIGDVVPFIKEKLSGYEFTKAYESRNYFNRLNESPDINILMGSRAFYEGWDSPRPNIINYINIGSSSEAQKFVLQSMGRGVRIEPIINKRKRIEYIYKAGGIDSDKYRQVLDYVLLVETLFIYATSKKAIKDIVDSIKLDMIDTDEKEIELELNTDSEEYLIPCYRKEVMGLDDSSGKINISAGTLDRLRTYLSTTPSQIILLQNNIRVNEYKKILNIVQNKANDIFKINDDYDYRDIHFIIEKLSEYIRTRISIVDSFKNVEDEIVHFKKIRVKREYYDDILEKIRAVSQAKAKSSINIDDLVDKLKKNEITNEEFMKTMALSTSAKSQEKYMDLVFKYIPEHYYVPIILSEKEKVDYVKHIIKVESEVKFINKLEQFLHENQLKDKYDWWKFCKLDESLDKIYIPYFDENGTYRKFKPDFIFWMKKENKYRIVFVDPKGPVNISWLYKLDGYKKVFEGKVFKSNNYEIEVHLRFFEKAGRDIPGDVSKYWIDDIGKLFL